LFGESKYRFGLQLAAHRQTDSRATCHGVSFDSHGMGLFIFSVWEGRQQDKLF
jgi:hypothetical protein